MTLDQIGLKCQTDKASSGHNYLVQYERIIGHLKDEPITLLEVGYGGYHYPNRGGQSMRMWREYFSTASIHAFDIYIKTNIPPNTFLHIASQDSPEQLEAAIRSVGQPDLIIDDGSHISPLTITTFKTLFPHLKKGGIYIVEDLHTSYWGLATDGTDFKGGDHPDTIMNYMKTLTDTLNHENELGIESISFHTKFVVIKKC